MVAIIDRVNNNISLYIDGLFNSISDSTNVYGDISNDLPFYIGAKSVNENYFHGDIDDIRIYNRALTQPEILALYNQGANPAPTLISPQNNNTVNDNNLTFEWTEVTGAAGYEIQADEECSFTTPEINRVRLL